MWIDEGRRHQIATGVDLGPSWTLELRLDRSDRLAGNADVGDAAIRKPAAAHNKIEIHLSSSRLKNHCRIVSQKTPCRSGFFPWRRKVPSGGISLYKPPSSSRHQGS